MDQQRKYQASTPGHQLIIMLTGIVTIALLIVMIVTKIIDSRSTSFENRASYRPPASDDFDVDAAAHASDAMHVVYIPAYSHIYIREGGPYLLSITLSIRNLSSTSSCTLHEVNYFDSEGMLARKFINSPLKVAPRGSKEFLISERDTTGGVGANFIVSWSSKDPAIDKPLMESIMIGTSGAQGISFTSRGVELKPPSP